MNCVDSEDGSLPKQKRRLSHKIELTRLRPPRLIKCQLRNDARIGGMSDVTDILLQLRDGNRAASERLLPTVYDELRKLANHRMTQEAPDHILEATALVHEAYIRLVDHSRTQQWDSRGHFFSAAAEAMRRILIEQARQRQGPKAGGGLRRIELSNVAPEIGTRKLDFLALDEALERLAGVDPRAAQLVKLRFFAGLKRDEAAEVLGVSLATVDNDWAYAKGWLKVELSDKEESS